MQTTDLTQATGASEADHASHENPGRIRPKGDLNLHVVFLVLCGAVLLLAVVLEVQDRNRVRLPGISAPLPELCTFKRSFGVGCPGCGLTRCFISVVHGNVVDAWLYNPAGLFFFLVVAFQVPYRTVQIWRLRSGRAELNLHAIGQWSLIAVAVLMVVQWIVRMILTLV